MVGEELMEELDRLRARLKRADRLEGLCRDLLWWDDQVYIIDKIRELLEEDVSQTKREVTTT